MELKEVKALSDTELRIKVAALCGWDEIEADNFGELRGYTPDEDHPSHGSETDRGWRKWKIVIPDFPHDLDAVHEAEEWLAENSNGTFANDYPRYLTCVVAEVEPSEYSGYQEPDQFDLLHATASQRCGAIVLTMS